MSGLLDQLSALPLVLIGAGVLLLMVIDTTALIGLAVPSDAVILTTAGAVGFTGAPVVAIAAIIGTLIGWSISFVIGRRVGPSVRASRVGRWIGDARWHTATELLAGRSGRILLVLQFLPVVNALIPLLAGTLRMPYHRFLRLAGLSTVAWAVAYTLLGNVTASAGGALLGTSGSLLGPVLIGLPGLLIGSILLAGQAQRSAGNRDGQDAGAYRSTSSASSDIAALNNAPA